MGFDDKVSNKTEDFGGKAKEGIGKVSGDKSLENEGKSDQAKASVKEGFEKVKDGVEDAVDTIKDKLSGDKHKNNPTDRR